MTNSQSKHYDTARLHLLPENLVCRWLLLLQGCGDSDDNDDAVTAPVPVVYRAEITRTQYGIAHIVAEDWGGLGYGHGYAFAQDNYCSLMQDIGPGTFMFS